MIPDFITKHTLSVVLLIFFFRPTVCDPSKCHCFSGAGAAGITSCQIPDFKPWLSQSHKMNNCPQVALRDEAPANSTDPTRPYLVHNILALMGIFHQSTSVSITSHGSVLRQTICSQINSTAGQGSVDPQEQRMQMAPVHLLSQSAPWCFRSWYHFCWLGLGQSLLGCCLMWFRWGNKRKPRRTKKAA